MPEPRLVAWNRLWNTRNSTTAGMVSTTAPARLAPNGLAWRDATLAMKLARATASGPASARSYNPAGRLVEVVTSRNGHLRVPVAPGGFTLASR